jgi:hypothetical protein
VRSLFSFIILVVLTNSAYSQVSIPTIDFYAGVSAGLGEYKPFWNFNNQYAKHSLHPYEGLAGIKVISIDSSDSFLSLDYGLEINDRQSLANDLILHQAYAEFKTPYLNFWAGRKEEIIGNQDSTLSIGSTVWSANARPMPMLEVKTPGYIDVPLTKGYVEVNGSLAHGWFEQGRYVENVYMHQKQLHLRFGGDYFINASLGIIHFAQWGGISPDTSYGELPTDFDAYKRVFLAQNGDSSTVNINESINKLGNHLGSRIYRIDFKAEKSIYSIYYQTLFEDGSGLAHEFYRDGIAGLSLKIRNRNRIVNKILFEYLHTTYQARKFHNLNDSTRKIEYDNYFNNYIYKDGWTYNDMILGTPLITSPIYNNSGNSTIFNNRVLGFHFGLGGRLGSYSYLSYFTFSMNKGTFYNPFEFPKNQFSWYFETTLPSIWKGIDLNIQFAADIGKMYGNNLGINLLFRKTFNPF